MKSVKLGNEVIKIKPQSLAAIIKAEQVQREAGLEGAKLEGEDIIFALKRDPDILHKLAAVYYLNDAESLKRWPELWKQWADRYSALQMLPIIEAAVSATRSGVCIETLNHSVIIRGLRKAMKNVKEKFNLWN